MPRLKYKNVFVLIILLIFTFLTFDPGMSAAYIGMLTAIFMLWFFDENIAYPLERRTDNRGQAFLIAFVAWIVLIAITTILKTVDVQSAVQLFAQELPLKGNEILKVISWGFVIPVIETVLFFGIIFERLIDWQKKKQAIGIPQHYTINLPTAIIILAVSGMFTLFHLAAKIGNVPFFITMMFGIISCVLVVKYKELKQAALFHIITNTVAIIIFMGLLRF